MDEPPGEGMAEVFISYSQKERALVAPIAARLADLGVEAWFDREISAGESFGAVIRARLKEAKAILVCWSPEAIESKWVDAEAEYARGIGSYVPIFIAPCALLPPFNTIHSDDLSKWKGEATDPAWIRLIGRIAKLINREGVAAAAQVLATGDEQARYDFARRYPDEPIARKIWNVAEARHRELFAKRVAEAKTAAETKVNAERLALEARIEAAAPAFEVWLADEQRGVAKEPMSDPIDLIGAVQHGDDHRLREKNAALQSALAQTKAREDELGAAKAEIARLSGDLAALKAREALDPTENADEQGLRDEILNLQRTLDQSKAKAAELDIAQAETARLSAQLTDARAARSRLWVFAALIGLVAAGAGAIAERGALSSASDVGVARLNSELASARAALEVADQGQTAAQARTDSLVKEVQDARAQVSNLVN